MTQSRDRGQIRTFLLVVVLLVLTATALGIVFTAREPAGPRLRATGLDAIRVPPGFEVEVAVSSELVAYPMLGTLDDRGRLFFSESSGNTLKTEEMAANPDYIVRLVEDLDGDGVFDRSKIFADKLTLPSGAVWHGGSLYVATPPDLLRFEDTDDDGVADVKEVVLTGWNLSANSASMHGPFLGPDGWLYITDGRHGFKIRTKEGELLEGKSSRIWRCRLDGSDLESYSGGGMDNPVEIAFTEAGETFGTMTYFQDPKNGQRDAILHFVEGGVYPKPHPTVSEFKRTGELMPVMTKFARIAPAGLERYRGAAFGPEFEGNLFTAQFNPHRVQRHIVTRTGATFRTEDEDFLTSIDPDFHATDVIEDADGSLLVVDTGGWFIHGCPVSRLAKPEVRGAVYRVRKKGAPRVEDPRGEKLRLESRSPEELAPLLEDPRPAVRDRALNSLVKAGDRAIEPLVKVRESSASPNARSAAVFGLLRIRTGPALAYVRAALDDPNFLVRVAAARAVGLERDEAAVDRLLEMVRRDEPAARRQAATALGRIGDQRVAPVLLEAAATSEDRFVEHSIIYSLIQLKDSQIVAAGLRDPRPKVRKAALIALDQMDGSPLQRDAAVAMLRETDPDLRKATLWVLSHYPEWSSDVLRFLGERFRAASLNQDEQESLQEAMVSFCAQAGQQQLIADLLGESTLSTERRLALLETMNGCSLDEFPQNWVHRLGQQLESGNEQLQILAINLIQSRDVTSLDGELEKIARNGGASATLRTMALGLLVKREPQRSEPDLEFLFSQLKPETEPDLRLSAARVLANAQLGRDRLIELASGRIKEADALTLQSLLDAFDHTNDEHVGRALVDGLLASQVVLGDAGGQRLTEILKGFPESVRAAAEQLLARIRKAREERVKRLTDLEGQLAGRGDPTRGRKVFFGKKAACSTCHTIGMQGGDVGPDLTAVGAVRSPHDLLEAIIFPSASFVRGHEIYRVETANEVYSGVLRRRGRDVVVLVSGPNDVHRIPRDQIKEMGPSEVSLMPEGFDEDLTRRELEDLMAFLRSQTSRETAMVSGE